MATGRKAARATAVDFRDEFDEPEPEVIVSEPETDDFTEAETTDSEEEAARSTSEELSDLAQERLTQARLAIPHVSGAALLAEAHILAILAVAEAVRESKASP